MNYGNELFGMWIIFYSFWGIGSALDFGFGTTIVKFVAEAKSLGDYPKVNKLISLGFIIFLFVGVVMLVGGNLISSFVYFNNPKIVPQIFQKDGKLIFLLLGINFYLQYLSIFFKSVFEGVSNFVTSSKIILSYNVINFLSVVTAFLLKLSIIELTLLITSASLFLLALNHFILRHNQGEIKISLKVIDFSQIRSMMKFTFSMQTATLLGSMIDPVIKYLVGNYSSLSTIPAYEIARRFAASVSGLFFSAFRTILPKASILITKEDRQVFLLTEGIKSIKLGITYSGLVFGVGSFFIALLIEIWFGNSEIIFIFLILALPESINNFGFTLFMFLIGIGKPHYLALIQLINIIIIVISIITGFYFFNNNLGLLGYLFTVVVVNILMLWFVKRQTSISIMYFLKKVNVYKLVLLDILVLFGLFFISNHLISMKFTLALISVLSFLIFTKDLKYYSILLQNRIKTKYA